VGFVIPVPAKRSRSCWQLRALNLPEQLWKAGLAGRIPHDFRRTAVRNLERAGVPRSAAMAMVGHRTESIYRRYAIADEAMLREGAIKLAALHLAEHTHIRSGTREKA
jgi:integrase